MEGAQRAYDAAVVALTRIGDEVGLAMLGDKRAYALVSAGKLAEAEKIAKEALEIGRRVGNLDVQRDGLNVLGRVAQMHGDMQQAGTLWREALAIAKTLEDRSLVAGELGNVALVAMEQGKLVEATGLYEEAAAEARSVKAAGTLSRMLQNLAITWIRRDQFAKARQCIEEAIDSLRAQGSLDALPYALDSLGEIEATMRHFDLSRAALNEAILLREKAGNKAGRSRHVLAEVAMEEGKLAEADELARKAVSEFKAEDVEQVVFGLASLTAVLLREGKLAEADATMTELLETAARAGDDVPRKQYASLIARIGFALGRRAEGLKIARDAVDEATRSGTLGESGSLEVRVALGEMSLLAGDRATGLPLLFAAESEARQGENLLLADRARQALGGHPSIR
jgi:tetratricopeptide (TPR) repeat protein